MRTVVLLLIMVLSVAGGYGREVSAGMTGNDCAQPGIVETNDDAATKETVAAAALSSVRFGHHFDYKRTREWQKYKALRAVGWTALGVGLPTTFFGLVGSALSSFESGQVAGVFLGVAITGGALTVASVPILITAYHFRRKARRMKVEVGVSQIVEPAIDCSSRNVAPALCLKFNF